MAMLNNERVIDVYTFVINRPLKLWAVKTVNQPYFLDVWRCNPIKDPTAVHQLSIIILPWCLGKKHHFQMLVVTFTLCQSNMACWKLHHSQIPSHPRLMTPESPNCGLYSYTSRFIPMISSINPYGCKPLTLDMIFPDSCCSPQSPDLDMPMKTIDASGINPFSSHEILDIYPWTPPLFHVSG